MTASCWTRAPGGRSTCGKVPGDGDGAGDGATLRLALTSPSAGRKANEQERQAALSVAEQTITRMGYSPHTQVGGGGWGARATSSHPHRVPIAVPQVEILPQGHETPLFKQFFSGWK